MPTIMSADLEPSGPSVVQVGLNAVIVALHEDQPRVLVVPDLDDEGLAALPAGPFDPTAHRTLERGVRQWVKDSSGLDLGYVEQLYTFADRGRDPRESRLGRRYVSIGYLALTQARGLATNAPARWADIYDFLPWEDGRYGPPASLSDGAAALMHWADAGAEGQRRPERLEMTFALPAAPWDEERVLDRYELLYEVGLTTEAQRKDPTSATSSPALGVPMALDHRRMLATALTRLRGKLKYRPVIFELLPDQFTLLELQRAMEALSGVTLHKQNFRRQVERQGLVEGTGAIRSGTGGRPAELFQFRRQVIRERPTPGLGLPKMRI